ncbi:MAG: hypothetical protein MSA66_03200 [Oscillospiraceae bacterium]|nr:hypothetical protein [Oscillospiraceae bacterium]
MENRPSDKRSKISLDKVLREVAELENSRGEPDRIWSLSDIDDLLASTDTDSTAPADEDDTELLSSIQYYEDRYSDDDTPSGSEPVYTQQGTEEPKDQADSDPEIAAEPEPEIPSVAAEAATEPEIEESAESDDAEQTGKESDEVEEAEESASEISSSELNTPKEPVDETSSEEPANEETAEAPAEPEEAEAAQESADEIEPEAEKVKAEKVPADESEDIYSDSKFELSVVKADGEDDDIHESDNEVDTDESDESNESDNSDNILTLHGGEEESEDEDEAEKKPTVEELFGAPASRYFGEPSETPDEDSERESRAIPGLFGETVVFGPMKSLSEPTQSKPDDEYKTKLMAAIGSAKAPQSAETIEKPGVILKRGPLSETSGLEPLPQVIPAEEFVGSGDDKPASIEDQPFTNPAAGNQPEEEQMMLSGFGEEPETEKIDEDELRSELDKKRAEKKKKFVLLSSLGDDEPQEDENQPEEKENETEKQPEKKKKHSEKAPLEYEKPEQRVRVYKSLKNAASQFKTSVIGLCVLEGVSLLLLLVPKILEWAAIDAPAFDRGGAGLAAANIVLLLASFYLAFPNILSGVKALANGRVTGGAVGGLTFILALVQTILSFFNKSPEGASGIFYCAAAIFALLMTAENSSRGTERVMQNFLFCTAKRKSGLYGIRAIESEKDAFEVGRALKMGNPDILYSGRVEFPADFIKNSEANSPADSCIKRSLIISSAVSVLLAVISGIITKDIFQAFGVLTGAFCLTSPCAIELALMIPLYLENRKLNSEGGMIAGYDAALECSEAVAASVDSADLFDRAACEMHGMKDFHTVRIDDVLLYAVAIVLKSGGPLTDVFNRIIGGSTELLPPVRDMIYEDRLGLSATIYNQRVLLGNRNLLTHHNIEVPLKSEEDKVKRNGRKILYIAIDSQVAAMFVFNYAEDASLKDSINEMADNGFSLVVRTDDPNVTDELIAARFGIAQKDVKMTLSHGARIFSAYRDSVVDSAPAKVMHDGSARSYFKSIAACGRLANFASRWAVFALIVQAVVAAGAILCVALKAFAFVSPLTSVVVQAAIVAFGVILEKFKK